MKKNIQTKITNLMIYIFYNYLNSYLNCITNKILTIEEIKSMSPEEFVKNEKYIREKVVSGKVMSKADLDKMRQSGSTNNSSANSNNSKSGNSSSKSGGGGSSNGRSSKPSSGSSGGSSSEDGHWVTINGNHVLMED